MADPQTVIEGTLKYRDNKKWKPRWCVIRKLSPVADCLHLQLYRDSKDRCKNGPTKASLSLEGFLGMETGFTLDKESNTMAIICSEVVVVLAFDSRELLIQWQVKVRANLVEEHQFLVQIAHLPPKSKLASGPARLHLLDYMFCLTAGVPPKMLGIWPLKELRRFGVVDGKFCFEGGSRCVKGEGLHVLLTNQAKEMVQAFDMASRGRLPGKRKVSLRKTTGGGDSGRTCLKTRTSDCCGINGDKNALLFSAESSSQVANNEKDETTLGESHIRACHMHYRWPSCIVPCNVPTRDPTFDNKTFTRTATNATTHPPMLWAMGHCGGCSLHYTKRAGCEKEKAQMDSAGFTPQWTMDLNVISPSKEDVNTRTINRNRNKAPHDRSSLCSQSSQSSGTSSGSHTSSSSSSSISEYSVPKNCVEAFYDRPKNIHHIPQFNRLSTTEENPLNKSDAMTPAGGRLGPIREGRNLPPCTCWNQMPDRPPYPQDVPLVEGELVCTCWSRNKRHSVDVDMPSFSSSGSSNASPSTSPKKYPSIVGVPILLPCTCGKTSPYLNYAVPRSGAPVKDPKQKESSNNSMCRNITESEKKIINKVDNSSSYSLNEDNGNKLSNTPHPRTSEARNKASQVLPQQFCPCQKLLICPSGFLPSLNGGMIIAKNPRSEQQVSTTEYATISKREDRPIRPEPLPVTKDDSQSRQDQNINLRQQHFIYPFPMECCGNRMPPLNAPAVNTWKKDNANHIYVNLKYLQEQAADAENSKLPSEKMIPYYANLYFLQTLSFYENSSLLAARPSNLFPPSKVEAANKQVGKHSKQDDGKKGLPKKRLELPGNSSIYEMMSFNRESPSTENYMLMQPSVLEDPSIEYFSDLKVSESLKQPPMSMNVAESQSDFPNAKTTEASELPLRPFMPVLLPFHEHVCSHKEDGCAVDDTETDKNRCVKKDDGHNNDCCRSSGLDLSNDSKTPALRRGRSASSDGRHCEETKLKDDHNAIILTGSPKTTPIRKHPLLTKLTFRSKEKSFSTDEITPPSTVPPSPDSMFLENIQKYPFHRSADCLQLNEEYRLSDEDLSQDPETIMSESMSKIRSVHSIKRSSSVPCKANPVQQQCSSSGADNQTNANPPNQAAVFSHFIAYHGSLPRRCYGNAASRHPLIDRKVSASNNAETASQVQEKKPTDTSNVIYISECKQCHQLLTSPEGLLFLDTKSMTSSSSSEMSDYIESLSLCSRSSSGSSGVGCGNGEYIRTEELNPSKSSSLCTSSLRPRSGKEYHSFDRIILQEGCNYIPVTDCTHLALPCLRPFVQDSAETSDSVGTEDSKAPFRASSSNRTNSPSPGYVSSSPGIGDFVSPEKIGQLFVFPKESKDLNYLEVLSLGESEPTSPVVKRSTVQYAVIDMVATAAAEKLGAERAQLRDSKSAVSKQIPDDKEV